MARTNRSQSNKPSSRKANAIGFAKRLSRTPKASARLSDVYEYHTEKLRRSNVALSLGKEDTAELGRFHSRDEDDDGSGPSKGARLIGQNVDDEMIDSGDDEDLDSDAAFGDSDDETFAGHGFSRKEKKSKGKGQSKAQVSTRNVRFADVDLNENDSDSAVKLSQDEEDSGEEEGSEGDEFVDVLDILDGRAQPESDNETNAPGISHEQSTREDKDHSSQDDDEDAEDESSEEQPVDEGLSSDDEKENPAALEDLDAFITNLEVKTKRKAPSCEESSALSDGSRLKKRKLLKERTEAGVESEFAASQFSGQTKLSLEDLLAPLKDQSSNLLSLTKSIKPLASSSTKPLPAPLPQRTQERLDREAAYQQTKKEVDKWHMTMKRIKEAEHLSFPLQSSLPSQPSNHELVAKFKPTTSLETSVDKLLKKANMLDPDIKNAESLKMNHLSIDEVTARHAELRKMRDLMFRAEVKAKRLSKIKSKTYRRLRGKEKQKLKKQLGEEDEENDEEVRLRREKDRAEERATLKHKTTGKWAKSMKNRNELDEDQREDVLKMFERGQALRKKIRGDRGSDEEDEESDDEHHLDPEQIREDAFNEVSQLQADKDTVDPKDGKGVFSMKFMKDAMARDDQRIKQIADDFIKELGDPEGHDSDEASDGEGESGVVTIQRKGGRVTYRPGVSQPLRTVDSMVSDTSSVTLKSSDFLPDSPVFSPSPLKPTIKETLPQSSTETETNPWLTVSTSRSVKAPRKKNEAVVGKNSTAANRSKDRLRKHQQNHENEKERAEEDAVVEMSMTEVMNLEVPQASTSARRSSATQPSTKMGREVGDDDSDRNSELEDQEKSLAGTKGAAKRKARVKAFEQRELVALAFAGDKVVQDFQEEKQREINEDAPREVDTTLPGWGSWGGIGAKKAPPKPHLIKKVAGVDPKTRADYNKTHVIISEKRDKKAAKYMIKDLPYPYTSRAQFERSMQVPVGTEWNTRVGFQKGTLPRIVKKPGIIIEPLEKMTA